MVGPIYKEEVKKTKEEEEERKKGRKKGLFCFKGVVQSSEERDPLWRLLRHIGIHVEIMHSSE